MKKLDDGRSMPEIAFGSATVRHPDAKAKTVDDLVAALDVGFSHLDTAQQYGNEDDVGEAIQRSGVSREKLWITTKWSDGDLTVRESCENSLRKLRVDYVDLYVIHHTWTCKGDFEGAWRAMEEVHKLGYAKSIGLSAFGLGEVKEVLKSCTIKPVVNMIMFHPNVLGEMAPLVDFMSQNGIVNGGYSPNKPLWEGKNLELVRLVGDMAKRKGISPDQVLLSWSRAKGAVVFTSSTSRPRMDGYIAAGDVALSGAEVRSIDQAGSDVSS